MSPTLTNNKVSLRPIGPADAEAMFASLQNETVRHMTAAVGNYTREQVQQYCADIAADKTRADFAISANDRPKQTIGEVTINDVDKTNDSANFRIALYSEAFFGKGHGTAATQLVLGYAFKQMKLHRIELEVFDYNHRAMAIYERVGFVREGVKRQALHWQGRYHDIILMSMLHHEFKPTQEPKP